MHEPEQEVLVFGVDPLRGLGVDSNRPLPGNPRADVHVVRCEVHRHAHIPDPGWEGSGPSRGTDTTNPRLIGGYAPTFEGEVAVLPVPAGEPLAFEHDAFLRVVREGIRPEVDAEDGLWAVGIAIALLESAARREVVTLDGFAARSAMA